MSTRSTIASALRPALVALAFAGAACESAKEPPSAAVTSREWREFEGSWNASGTRHTIPLGTDRRASVINLSGTMLLSGADRPGVGFRAEVIGMVDSGAGLEGRGVWTDERGDQVFSDLKGEGTAAENRITGTILGGTGRYAGVTGSYEFSWRFVIQAEDGMIQGSTVGLKGRVRAGTTGAAGAKP